MKYSLVKAFLAFVCKWLCTGLPKVTDRTCEELEKGRNVAFVRRILNFLSMSGESLRDFILCLPQI